MVSDCPYSLDSMVRARLKKWPQHPPGLDSDRKGAWLRGRLRRGMSAAATGFTTRAAGPGP